MIDENSKNEITSFILNFLNIMNLKADIKIGQEEKDSINVCIYGDSLLHLIGKNGNVMRCIELILNISLNKGKEDRKRICLDICDYRQKRELYLKELAMKTAQEVVRKNKEIILPPLPPFERRIIHLSLLNNNNVTTYSKGDGKNRRVVVTLKK